MRLVQSQLNPGANSLQVLADVLPGRQLPQLLLVLVPVLFAVLASRLCRCLYIVCLRHVALLIFGMLDSLAPEPIPVEPGVASDNTQAWPIRDASQPLDSL